MDVAGMGVAGGATCIGGAIDGVLVGPFVIGHVAGALAASELVVELAELVGC